MNTKHTPQIVDFSDNKKAIKALKGSVDDAFLLLNKLEGLVKFDNMFSYGQNGRINSIEVVTGGTVAAIPVLSNPPTAIAGKVLPWILVGDYDTIQLVYPDGTNHNKQIVLSDIVFTP
jgi:hypothetical protein